MKSLEIVNEKIDYIETKSEHKCTYINIKHLQQIKQDLEVLEIIRNKRVHVYWLKRFFETFTKKNDEIMMVILGRYNSMMRKEYHLTLEELLKLKQWLEENE